MKKFIVDFIGIGAAKAGTTWLADCLAEHPEICFSVMKETLFFCSPNQLIHNNIIRYNGKNIDLYGLFYNHCGKEKIKGELSVHYLADPKVAARIKKHFPDVKIIAVLRNPVDRLISDYRYRKYTRKEEKKPLKDIIKKDEQLAMFGFYSEQLSRYYRLFPKENIKVVIYEEMAKKPLETIKSIYRFLGVDASFVPRKTLEKKVNATRRVRLRFIMKLLNQIRLILIRLHLSSFVNFLMNVGVQQTLEKLNYRRMEKEAVDEELRKKIFNFYKDDIKKVQKLLKKDLPYWK